MFFVSIEFACPESRIPPARIALIMFTLFATHVIILVFSIQLTPLTNTSTVIITLSDNAHDFPDASVFLGAIACTSLPRSRCPPWKTQLTARESHSPFMLLASRDVIVRINLRGLVLGRRFGTSRDSHGLSRAKAYTALLPEYRFLRPPLIQCATLGSSP